MKELHGFIPSPRAGKRFINIYRLLRASVRDQERDAFAGDGKGGPYQTAMLLLAVLTGYPDQATEIFRELIEKKPGGTWSEFRAKYEARILSERAEPNGSEAGRGGNSAKGEQKDPGKVVASEAATATRKADWIELFKKLNGLEGRMGGRPMDEFLVWAPRVARYSFQSGRVLYYQQE